MLAEVLTTEASFTRLCLRGRIDRGELEAARQAAAAPGLDWEAWLGLTDGENLQPLMYQVLRGQDTVPLDVEQVLRDSYDYYARRNLLLLHGLSEALTSLAASEIDVIVLKGAALAESVYGNLALRPMLDIDLLIRYEQINLAREALESSGFKADGEVLSVNAPAYVKETLLHKPGIEDVNIDLHWHLFSGVYYLKTLSMKWFWESSRLSEFDQAPALVLGPEAQLLHLCGHLSLQSANIPRLLWLQDVVEFVGCYQAVLDWDLLVSRTQACHLVLSVRQVLEWLADEWPDLVPGDVLVHLRKLHPSADEERLFAWHIQPVQSIGSDVRSDLSNLPRWSQKIDYVRTFLLTILFPTPEYMRARYQVRHQFLLPFYYLYRQITGVKLIFQHLANREERSF